MSEHGKAILSGLRATNRTSQTQTLQDLLDHINMMVGKDREYLVEIVQDMYINESDNDKVRISLLQQCIRLLVNQAELHAVEHIQKILIDDSNATKVLSICKILLESLTLGHDENSVRDQNAVVLCFAVLMKVCQSCICSKHFRKTKNFIYWIRKEFSSVFQRSNILKDKICDYIAQNAITSLCGCVIFQPMLIGAHVDKYSAILQTVVLDQFLKRIQGVSKAQPELTNPLWGFFTECLLPSHWEGAEGLEVQMVKSFKKSPETFCLSALNIVKTLNPNISMGGFCSQGGVALCVRVMKSEDVLIRHGACQLLTKALEQIGDDAILMNSLVQLVESLHGKFPGVSTVSIPQDHHKIALLLVLLTLFQHKHIGGTENHSQRDLILSQLKSLWTKEKDLGMASLVATVVATFIKSSIVGDSASEPTLIWNFLDALKTDLEKAPAVANNVTRFSILVFLVEFMNDMDKTQYCRLTSFHSPLHNLIKDAVKKQAWTHELTFALSSLLELAGMDKDLAESLKVSKVTNALSSSSFAMFGESYRHHYENPSASCNYFYAIEDLSNYPSSLAVLQNSINFRCGCISVIKFYSAYAEVDRDGYGKLLATGMERVSTVQDISAVMKEQLHGPKCNPAYELLLHGALMLNRFSLWNTAKSYLRDPLQQYPMFTISWLYTCWNKISTWSSHHETALELERLTIVKQNVDSVANSFSVVKPLPSISSDLKAIISLAVNSFKSTSQNESVLLVFFTAILIGHPMVSRNLSNAIRWTKLNFACNINLTDDQVVCDILATRLFQAGQLSCSSSRLAAHRAIRILCELLPSGSFNSYPILNKPSMTLNLLRKYGLKIVESLNQDSIFHLTDEDKKIYNFPELVVEEMMNEARQKIETEASEITNADRKKAGPRSSRKGTFGGDVVEDEEWAEKVRKEKAAKLIQANEALELDGIKQKVYDRKNTLKQLIAVVTNSFEAIKDLTFLSEEQCRFVMTDVMSNSWLWQYFGVSIIDEFARGCLLAALTHILEVPLKPVAW